MEEPEQNRKVKAPKTLRETKKQDSETTHKERPSARSKPSQLSGPINNIYIFG